MSSLRIHTISATMRTMAQITLMKEMAMRPYKPLLREKGTRRLYTTGMGRSQMITSSDADQALLKVSKVRMSMQWGDWSGLPSCQYVGMGVHWNMPP